MLPFHHMNITKLKRASPHAVFQDNMGRGLQTLMLHCGVKWRDLL